jgi:hypothetical protein
MSRRPAIGGRRRRRPDAGAVSAELVVATPLALLLVLLAVQFAVWAHAQHVAQAVAGQALAAARVQDGSEASGRAEAADVLRQVGGRVLVDPQVTVARSAATARVELSGYAETVVPGFHLRVHAAAEGPVERVTGP